MNGYETLRVMSKETYTEIEELKTLTVGEFFCRMGNGRGFILKVPDKHLGKTTCRNEQEWAEVLKGQVSRYYKARALHSPTPAPPPQNTQESKSEPKQERPQEPPIRDRKEGPEPQRPPKQQKFKPKYGG